LYTGQRYIWSEDVGGKSSLSQNKRQNFAGQTEASQNPLRRNFRKLGSSHYQPKRLFAVLAQLRHLETHPLHGESAFLKICPKLQLRLLVPHMQTDIVRALY
jgi:hypothetical protein